MHGRNAQQLTKRQEYIKVHVFYKRGKDKNKDFENSTLFDFLHFYLGPILFLSFWAIFTFIFLSQLCLFHGFIDLVEIPTIFAQIFFSAICVLIFLQYDMFVEELNSVFFLDYKFSFIIDASSLIHEIIHGHIFEKFQDVKRWEVWVVNKGSNKGSFKCFGYVPENVRFPNFIIKIMICELFHLIHDLISSFFDLDVYYIFDYLKEFFTMEKICIKELKTQIKQIKARKTRN
ncbi:hypothetical protein ES704_01470 [subsurface metagenome]|jgi:hypothetical protein